MIPSRFHGIVPGAALTATPGGLRARTLRLLALVAVAVLVLAWSVIAFTAPAHAAGRVDVSPAPNAEGESVVTLSGSGFQYQPNSPGGVYVFFGSVQDPATNSWAPSQGGKSGTTFGYAGGSSLLIAFEGGSSAEAANGVIRADGTWTAQMRIPGASFPSSSGNPHAGAAVEGAAIDCTQVQCGVITIGAHGMINANNESFTPVGFVTASGEVVSGTGGASFTDEATQLAIPDTGSSEEPTAGTEATEDENAPGAAEEDEAEPQPAASPETVASDTGISSTALVIGVLGFAVVALLAAIVIVVVRRSRAARTARPDANGTDPAAGESGAPPMDETKAPVKEETR